MVQERLNRLRKIMEKEGIDWYLVPSEDFHGSEYVGDYFKCREFITGFTGSAGTALIGREEGGLWTDGRYFLQAASELKESGLTLYRQGEAGVPSIVEFLKNHIKRGMQLGADYRTLSADAAENYKRIALANGGNFIDTGDLLEKIWENRPEAPHSKAILLQEDISGKSTSEKIALVREKMKEKNADVLLLSSLDEIAWLFNIRGNDIACCPLLMAYAMISQQKAYLFLKKEAVTEELEKEGIQQGFTLLDYESIYDRIRQFSAHARVWIDRSRCNAALCQAASGAETCLDFPSPVILLKAIKNDTEIEGFRKAHLADGLAVTRFMYWLSQNAGKEEITEISAAEKQEEFRRQADSYVMPSFDPISAYGTHGAIVHYSADENTNIKVENHGFLLMDTGGHYTFGSTDITRTFAVGALSYEEKKAYTKVLIGNLRLAATIFPYGCSGENLDLAARLPLWNDMKDFRHGTGHGVGHIMNVHEGPQAFRWRHLAGRATAVLEPGMVISDEPGYYEDGRFGIRLENLLVCREMGQSEYGRFLGWEVLTVVPFDLNAVLPQEMESGDKELLNSYHLAVRERLFPLLTDENERKWLLQATRAI